MSGTKVTLDMSGFTQIRQSPEMQAILNQEAAKIADRANSMSQLKYGATGYHPVEARATDKGSIALVSTQGDLCATLDNAQHNTLRKAIQSGE